MILMMVSSENLVGAVAFSSMIVRPGDTAVAIGVGDLPVLANSLIINAMQSAAIASIAEHLANGETTVETYTALEFHGGIAIGGELRTSANCTEVNGRELTFICESYEGERLVASAVIKRTAVERVSFLARTA
ncbi:MAG: thioesterase family protein, partial [Candidatus Planktophila sp.]